MGRCEAVVTGWEDTLTALRERATKLCRHIAVSDGDDDRVLQAVRTLHHLYPDHALRITLIGTKSKLEQTVPSSVDLVAPVEEPWMSEYIEHLQAQRSPSDSTKLSKDEWTKWVSRPEVYSALMVDTGRADGMLGGASAPTAHVLRAGLRVIGLQPGRTVVSGTFFMLLPKALPGGQSVLAFADCAVIPDPDARQLAQIAKNTADALQAVFETSPVVAFLSFATKGSAVHHGLQKIQSALRILSDAKVPWAVDGELQADAAIIPEVAVRKDPLGRIQGHANVLIFPDLNAANIAYKLVERTADAKALGVVLSGFAKPVNDLSRGCSVEDIVDMICVTALQAGPAKDRLILASP